MNDSEHLNELFELVSSQISVQQQTRDFPLHVVPYFGQIVIEFLFAGADVGVFFLIIYLGIGVMPFNELVIAQNYFEKDFAQLDETRDEYFLTYWL